jgi:hypothetical protein
MYIRITIRFEPHLSGKHCFCTAKLSWLMMLAFFGIVIGEKIPH